MRAFCPGHITCFFHPVRTDDVLTTGSRGAGIRLSKGAYVTLEERSDDRVEIVMDGVPTDARVTRKVLELIRPGEGFDVTVENELPVSQGFGMSAAGAIAVAMAALGEHSDDCYRYAHMAEVMEGGGLGDVSAIMCQGHQPVRKVAGLPPTGVVEDTGISFDELSLVVLGNKVDTGSVLDDTERYYRLEYAGMIMMEEYVRDPSKEWLFAKARNFSHLADLETYQVTSALEALDVLEPENFGAMCMLGNSIFTDLPEWAAQDLFGEDASVYACSSSDEAPRLL